MNNDQIDNGTLLINSHSFDVNKSLIKQINELSTAINSMAIALADKISNDMKEISSFAVEMLNTLRINHFEAVKILRKYKWLLTPSMTPSFVHQIKKLGKKRGNQLGKINKLYVSYFMDNNCNNVKELIMRWSKIPLLKSRIKILLDCYFILRIQSKTINTSNVVLPVLIAQIDGILTDYGHQKGLYRKENDWKNKFRNQITNPMLFESSIDLANEVLLDLLFQKSIPGKPLSIPFTFNRHKIMHGENTKYGRTTNVIRALLIIDFLSYCK
jgi:hypothetical protein